MKTYVNLLPWEYRRDRLLRRRLKQWSLVWLACAVLAGIFAWTRYERVQQTRAEMLARQQQTAPVQELLADVRQLRLDIQQFSERETLVGQLREDRPPLTALGLVGRAARACGGRLRLTQLTFDRQQSQQANAPAVLTINGLGLDYVVVARFVVALQEAQAFDQVGLKSSGQQQVAGGQLQSFLVESKF